MPPQPTRLPLQKHTRDMQKRIPILISAIALAISASAQVGAIDRNRLEHGHPPSQSSRAASEQEKKQKYTCPMHREVVMNHPGTCPKCGMTLVPMKDTKRSTSNIQHSTSNSGHVMHDANGEAMLHHDHGATRCPRLRMAPARQGCRCNPLWTLPIR